MPGMRYMRADGDACNAKQTGSDVIGLGLNSRWFVRRAENANAVGMIGIMER